MMKVAETEVSTNNRRTSLRVVGLTLLVVLLGAFGNLSLAWGMKHVTIAMGANPVNYVRAIASPFVALGIALLILWLMTRMVLLSRADLSFVLPATAIGYVVNAVLSISFLNETITGVQWAGTVLIFLGAILVGSESKVNTDG